MFLLSLLSVLVVLSVWLVTWHCHVVVVVEVVERLQEVARIGGGGDEVEVDDGGGQEGKCLFVHDVYASFRQTPLTRLSIKHNGRLHDLLRKFLLSIVSLYIRQALDPHLRHGPRKLGRACGAGHSLPGARPLDPLVRMLDPSSGTHV